MIESWHSYPKVYALGHAAVADLLLDPVLVQEKVDGSQFSFGKFRAKEEDGGGLYLRCRSRGAELNIDAPDRMFEQAVATCKELFEDLKEGWTYRGEYLAKPKHNVLAYDRVPKRNIILFDINTGNETYASFSMVHEEAARLGLEAVPYLGLFKVNDPKEVRDLLDRTSILGGQKVEGVVMKNYSRFGRDGKVLMGKFVAESFKEKHGKDWKDRNPAAGDILQRLIGTYRCDARWAKAVQHLREAGKLEDSPKDIGAVIKEVQRDLEEECGEEIRDALFKWAIPAIRRGASAGVAEWYKEQLLHLQFDPARNKAVVEPVPDGGVLPDGRE